MSDFTRIQGNVQKMISQQAPTADIDGYLAQEGMTPDQFKASITSPAGIASTAQAMAPHTLGQKFVLGVGDIGLGLGETIAHSADTAFQGADALGSKFKNSTPAPSTLGPAISDIITNRENAWQTNRAQNNDTGTEWARLGGQIAGAAPAMALMPEAEPGFIGGAVNGAGQSAVAGLMQPIGNASEGYGSAKFKQFLEGTGVGGVFGGTFGWLAGKKPTQMTSSDEYRDAVDYLKARNVTPTIGQNIGPNAATWEDKFSTLNLNVPGAQKDALKSYNVAALNEAISPLGLSYNGLSGNAAFKNVNDIIDKAYDSIKSRLSLPVPDSLRTRIGHIVSDAATPDASIATTAQKILDKALYARVDQSGVLTGAAFKAAESDLGKYAKNYMRDSATATERQIGEALTNIQGALRDSLEDANPALADQLRATNRAYAILARVQDAVPVGNPDRLFTPYQLAASVARADNTVRGRAYTEGDALLQKFSDAGLRVLGNKFPDSGTAARAMNADPFALAMQTAATIPTYPLYSKTGTKLVNSAVGGVSNAAKLSGPLLSSAARAAQPITPYLMPGILGMSRGSGLLGK